MNLSDTLQALVRRWYILIAGVLLACGAGYGAWTHTSVDYERSASQLLLPSSGLLPSNTANPYLYLGGLTQAADVVVRVAGSENTMSAILQRYPGTTVTVSRDPSTSGPVILIIATSTSDRDAAAALNAMVAQTATTLQRVQAEEHIRPNDQITMTTLTVDSKPTLQQRKRLISTGGAAIGVMLITVLSAALVDGLARRRRRAKSPDVSSAELAATEAGSVDLDEVHDAAPAGPRPTDADDADLRHIQLEHVELDPGVDHLDTRGLKLERIEGWTERRGQDLDEHPDHGLRPAMAGRVSSRS